MKDNAIQNFISKNEQGHSVMWQGSPICTQDKTLEQAKKIAIQNKIQIKKMWNGILGKFEDI